MKLGSFNFERLELRVHHVDFSVKCRSGLVIESSFDQCAHHAFLDQSTVSCMKTLKLIRLKLVADWQKLIQHKSQKSPSFCSDLVSWDSETILCRVCLAQKLWERQAKSHGFPDCYFILHQKQSIGRLILFGSVMSGAQTICWCVWGGTESHVDPPLYCNNRSVVGKHIHIPCTDCAWIVNSELKKCHPQYSCKSCFK